MNEPLKTRPQPGGEAAPAGCLSPLLVTSQSLLLVAGMAVATHSVVRYRFWIVLTYLVLAIGLAALNVRDRGRTSPLGPATLALTGVLAVTVHAYTYLDAGDARGVRWLMGGTALAAGAVLATRARRAPEAALGVAASGYVIAAALLIHFDPTPKIDVWVTLQQAADGLARGGNMYSQQWRDSPGVQDAFTYLPWTAVLLAPGRWLAGDVRWALVVVALLGAFWVHRLGAHRQVRNGAVGHRTSPDHRHRRAAATAAVLLLLLPGTATQVEQAWTEPLLLACLAGWALAVSRGRLLLAVLALAVGLACKQHLALLLPLLAAWSGFGARRTLASAAGAGVLVLPWFLASPADMWHDVVSILVSFQPLLFADTLYIAAIHELGRIPPFWLTGAAVLGVLVAATVMVRRRSPDLGTVLRWCALVLFVANLVNKQAFYNQYWLVAALVVLSWAVPPGTASPAQLDSPPSPAEAPAVAR